MIFAHVLYAYPYLDLCRQCMWIKLFGESGRVVYLGGGGGGGGGRGEGRVLVHTVCAYMLN